jgi:hypothetical protein
MINSYSQIYNLGHAALGRLLDGPVLIEEKVDGSQFSFGKDLEGNLHCRSKGAQINMIAPEGMFARAVQTVEELGPMLVHGWVYRGEYLAKPKHNSLAYDRVPKKHILLFDVNPSPEDFLPYDQKRDVAEFLGLECVPCLKSGIVSGGAEEIRALLEQTSVLGGQSIEGVVIKPSLYNLFGADKKVLMGKFVSAAFREINARTWKNERLGPNGILEQLQGKYGTPARWQKAVIHLREKGLLGNDPRDIGLLLPEIIGDIERECWQDMLDDLWAWAWPQLKRRVVRGAPEWYKEQLSKSGDA